MGLTGIFGGGCRKTGLSFDRIETIVVGSGVVSAVRFNSDVGAGLAFGGVVVGLREVRGAAD